MARLGEQTIEGNQVIRGNQTIPPIALPEPAYHLDATATTSRVDISANAPTVSAGDSVLMAVAPTQIGSASHDWYPGIFAGDTDAWDDTFTFYSSAGGAQTTSPARAQMIIEDTAGERGTSAEFDIPLDEFSVVGFAINDDLTLDWFFNDTVVAEGSSTLATWAGMNMAYFGNGYGGQTNDGQGSKYIDEFMYFPRTISAAEVSDYYNNGIIPDNPGARYAMNEGEGTTTVDETGTYADGSLIDTAWVEGDAF